MAQPLITPPPVPPPAPPPAPPAAPRKTLRDFVEETARKYEVDPALAFTILNKESSGVHQAADGTLTQGAPTKWGQAQGFFQVLPSTAAGYKRDDGSAYNLADPFDNIEVGIRNIREARDRDPNPSAIFAYYHGGPDAKIHGPKTEQYVREAMADFRQLLEKRAAGTPDPATPAPRATHRGGFTVPTAAEVAAQTHGTDSGSANVGAAPPWYSPDQLRQTGEDVLHGVIKSPIQLATNLGKIVHKIPGVTDVVDRLYGEPGLSARAFADADKQLAPINRAETVGKVGGDIGTAIAAGGPISRAASGLSLLPRMAAEGLGAAGIAEAQGQDPLLAGGIGAGLSGAAATARALFAGDLNPIAQRAVDWGRARGIPVDLATQTSSRWVKNTQKFFENTPLGAVARAARQRVKDQRMTQVGEEIAADIHPTPITRLGAGRSVGAALDQKVEDAAARAKKYYGQVETIHADPKHTVRVPTGKVNPTTGKPRMTKMQVPVDVDPIRKVMKPVLRSLLRQPVAQQEASPALPALRALFRGGQYRSLLDLEADLGAIKRLADASGGLRDKSQGLAAKAVGVLQNAIDDAARTADPDMLTALQKARRATAVKHARDKLRDVFVGSAATREVRGAQAMRGYKQAVSAEDINLPYLQKLAKTVGQGEMRKLGRAYFQRLLRTSTKEGGYERAARIANEWDQLGDETKQLLYSRQHVADIDNFLRLGRMAAEHPNPSGSGLYTLSGLFSGAAIASPTKGVPAVLGAGAVSYLMNHPTGVRLLTQGLRIPGGTPAAAQWAEQVQRLLKDQPTGTPPPRPPSDEKKKAPQ